MDPLDAKLTRATQLFYENLTDDDETELNALLPDLLEAGYVEDDPWGDDPEHFLWSFTEAGVKRSKELEDC